MKQPEKEWWYPHSDEDQGLTWLCDHLGDASEVMNKLWEELCKLDPSLNKDGYEDLT